MDAVFDSAEDELQVFLAEADEHLQMLDEGLVQLERRGDDAELLQAIFRAAHTLKGSAGVIRHRRMANLTHAMKTALDGLRKQTLSVTTPLVDACLEALDALRLLRNEVAEGEPIRWTLGRSPSGFRPANGAPVAPREYVVAVRWGKVEMGLIVDRLVGEQELVVKSLGPLVGETPGVSGAAILGDGSVALIVDVPGLFKLASRADD